MTPTVGGAVLCGCSSYKFMDKGVIQASGRPPVFGYTNREDYENISDVSMERKLAGTAHRSSRKAHHPNPLMNAIGQKKHSSSVLLTGTTRSFVLTWRNKDGRYHTTYKKNSKNTSNVADWSMAFYAYNAVLAIMNDWLRSAVPTVGVLGERRGFCPSCGARRMAESAAQLVDEVHPHEPMHQLLPWMACSRAMQEHLPRVLSFPFQLRFLFASRPELMGKVLGIDYRAGSCGRCELFGNIFSTSAWNNG